MTAAVPVLSPEDDAARVPVRRGNQAAVFALVDPEDLDRVLAVGTWRLHSGGYAAAKANRIFMHRLVLGLVKGDCLEADHINGDKLDNRRQNLRVVDHRTNGQNLHVGPFRGAWFHKHTRRWAAQASGVYLGLFDSRELAAAAAAVYRAEHMPGSIEYLARHPTPVQPISGFESGMTESESRAMWGDR